MTPSGKPKYVCECLKVTEAAVLRAIKNAVPGMHIHAFSPMEIVYGVELTGMTLRDYLMMLRDNGLDTLPGTAAEILDDSVRLVLSRNKLTTSQWCEIIQTAVSNPSEVREQLAGSGAAPKFATEKIGPLSISKP